MIFIPLFGFGIGFFVAWTGASPALGTQDENHPTKPEPVAAGDCFADIFA